MGVLERDADATAETLGRWLTERAGLAAVDVTDVSIPGSTGWSNETVFFTASWHDDGAERHERLVARIAPGDYRVFPDDTFELQYEVMGALSASTTVPMAAVHWYEPDASWFGQPFWIMTRVDGDIAADTPHYAGHGWLHEASPAQQATAWWSGVDTMADVHTVDVSALALPPGTLPGGDDPLGSALDHYADFLEWAEDGRDHTTARRALDWLRANRPPDPAEGPALVWGDARLSNLIYRDHEVVAVLDWEMCRIGDPLLDVGWWIFADDALTRGSGFERLPGFPSSDETGTRWAERTGRSVDALDYFVTFGGLRFTVIMCRMGALLADMGLVPADFAFDNLISQALDERLARS